MVMGRQREWSEYRTSATRYIHAPGFRKDDTYSLFDALDPQASRDFLADVHEQYKKYIGDEFGRTVLGFMGDEPSFPGVPYTARIYDEFERRKGYDIRSHLAQLFARRCLSCPPEKGSARTSALPT